ncbi:MAG TPA: hypothetical protein ENJ60_03260 [Aeromonadales bacterium]|nr:hypothetical protein [Aeromonadales bacterium]
MAFSNLFLVSCRSISMLIVLLMGLSFALEGFSFRAIFIGLLFSHFAMGFYYSKNNVLIIKQKKFALTLASIVLLVGLYFAIYVTYLAPYFLVVHAALSDAYLLKTNAHSKNSEILALLRTVFYTASGSIAFIEMPVLLMNSFLIIGFLSMVTLLYIAEDKKTQLLFELPLFTLVIFTLFKDQPLHFHYMGFYHIVTWYVFSFWMLFFKEKNVKKTLSFFSKIALMSVAFILIFNNVLDYSITDNSFLQVIGVWSILHIFSTIPLSKFNPVFLKKIFYAT